MWTLAAPVALALRYDFVAPSGTYATAMAFGVGCGVLFFLLGSVMHLYQGRYVVGTFDEVFGIFFATLVSGTVGTCLLLFAAPSGLPRSLGVLTAGIAGAAMLGARFAWRGTRQQSALSRDGTRTLIYGAGDAGSQLASLMLSDQHAEHRPVGFIDDNPNKQHLRRSGIRVLGTVDDLETIVKRERVQTLLVAIAGIDAPRLLALDARCKALAVTIRIIPTTSEIVGGAVKLGDISEVTDEDLLGRSPVRTDEDQITDFLSGKRILVTGAGGSIGSELSRQLSRYSPERLLLLDRDESALHAVQLSLDASGALQSEDLILADIRDAQRLQDIFLEYRPHIVFHAAALKHLPFLERFPQEALKTNVCGTQNVLLAAASTGVTAFVNISTDKAADPTSVLGYTKLITERLTAGISSESGGKFVSVRFGNVLGSRGSVIDTFRFQIERGGPVTVTDQRVTRYFMTVTEAVHLVLQAAVIGEHGETLILDMGVPVRIVDVARKLIERSGREISIQFTGLRSGEKLHEDLASKSEKPKHRAHTQISHVRVPPLPCWKVEGWGNETVSASVLRSWAYS